MWLTLNSLLPRRKRWRAFFDFGCCALILLPILLLPFSIVFLPVFAIIAGLLFKPKTAQKPDRLNHYPKRIRPPLQKTKRHQNNHLRAGTTFAIFWCAEITSTVTNVPSQELFNVPVETALKEKHTS